MNNNKQPQKREGGFDPEMFAIANRRRERPKPAPMPDPEHPARPAPAASARPQAQPKPQPQTQPDKKAIDAERRRLENEKKAQIKAEQERIRNEEKKKRDAEKRLENDRKATEKRERTKARREALIEKLESVKKTNKNVWRDALAYFVIFLCVLLIICTGTATLYLWDLLNFGEKPDVPKYVTFTAGQKDTEYDYSDIVREGICYVDFGVIAQMCEMSLGGDSEVFIYSTRNGEQIRFEPPSRTVIINGNSICAEGDILAEGNTSRRLWVPASLISEYMLGIEVKIERGIGEESGKPYINITAERTGDKKHPDEVAFRLKFNSVLSGIPNDSLPDEPITLPAGAPVYEYAADLTRYLQYMCPEDFDKHMLLVSPSHPSSKEFVPDDLVGVPNPRYDNGTSLTRDASMSLEALFLEMHTLGFKDMKINVGYRSYETQYKQFDLAVGEERNYYHYYFASNGKWFSDKAYEVLGKTYLEEKYISQDKKYLTLDDAKRVALTYSAAAGTSDHQSGLGFDLYLAGYSGAKFAESEEYKWLLENAHKFGFIFRYPEGKENITGFSFEPYHLRFVGQYHAAIIYESGLTLDEYIDKYLN